MPHSQVPLHAAGFLECFHSLLCLGPSSDWCHQVFSPVAANKPQPGQCPPWRKKDCDTSHRQDTAFQDAPSARVCPPPGERCKGLGWPYKVEREGRGKDEGSAGLTKVQGRSSTPPLIPRPCSQGGHPSTLKDLTACQALRHSMPASSLKIPFSIHGEIEAHWVEALFSKQQYLLSALDASFLQDTLPHQHPQPRHERGQHPHLTDSNSPSNY